VARPWRQRRAPFVAFAILPIVSALWACGMLLGLPGAVEVTDAAAHDAAAEDGAQPQDSAIDSPYLTNVTDYCLGYGFACAILDGGGAVACWGAQCGDGGALTDAMPVPHIVIEGGATQLACGFAHACATVVAENEKTLYCWGGNDREQVTGDDAGRCIPMPARIVRRPAVCSSSHVQVEQVAAGSDFTCAQYRCAEGAQRPTDCWGGGDALAPPPTVAEGALGFAQLVAGGTFACTSVPGSGANAGIYCWGANANGVLGGGNDTTTSYVTYVNDILELFAGNASVCYETPNTGNAPLCAGSARVAMGYECADDAATPNDGGFISFNDLAIPNDAAPLSLGLGGGWSCFLNADAGSMPVQCTGDNSSCQLSYVQDGGCSPPPPDLVFSGPTLPENVVSLEVEPFNLCYSGSKGVHTPGFAPGYPPDASCVVDRGCTWEKTHNDGNHIGPAFVSAFGCVCASTEAGENMLYCWGSNSQGELGRGLTGPPSPEAGPVVSVGR
jgi:hypothetical protein